MMCENQTTVHGLLRHILSYVYVTDSDGQFGLLPLGAAIKVERRFSVRKTNRLTILTWTACFKHDLLPFRHVGGMDGCSRSGTFRTEIMPADRPSNCFRDYQ